MTIGLVLDATMAILLVATISFCIVLYRRLQNFRTASLEIKSALAGFSSATLRAEASTAGLRKTAGDLGEQLQTQIETGRALADELEFLLESATKSVPDRGSALAFARDASTTAADDAQDFVAETNILAEQTVRSEAERELLEAMRQAR